MVSKRSIGCCTPSRTGVCVRGIHRWRFDCEVPAKATDDPLLASMSFIPQDSSENSILTMDTLSTVAGPMHRTRQRERDGCKAAMAVCVALFMGAGLSSCVRGEDETHAPHSSDHADEVSADEAGVPLEIPEDAQRNAGMRFAKVERHEYPVPMEVTGIVAPVASRVARLRPLGEGIIERIDVNPGDRVQAGQVLVHYDNIALGDHVAEYRSAVADLAQAEIDLEIRQHSFQRAEQLIILEAISQRGFEMRRSELEQAQANLLNAQAKVNRVRERIHRFGLTDNDLSEVILNGNAVEGAGETERHRRISLNAIRAPFSGIVTEYGIGVGDLVGPEREILTITDISTVWVLADVYESDLGRLPTNATVSIKLDAWPNRTFAGQLTYVSDVIESTTRAAHVRCVVANPDGILKLGMFARVSIPTNESISSLAVPISAVQRIDEQPVVFVQTGPTAFERRDVALGAVANGLVEVVQGLQVGESIVSNGSFYLKSALLQERIGHSH